MKLKYTLIIMAVLLAGITFGQQASYKSTGTVTNVADSAGLDLVKTDNVLSVVFDLTELPTESSPVNADTLLLWKSATNTHVRVSVGDLSATLGTDTNDYVDGASFNNTDGNLTLTRTGALPDLIVNLDGRYLESYTETDPVFTSHLSNSITAADTTRWGIDTNTNLTQEQVEDFAFDAARFGTGTRTLITVTYDDVNNNVDFVVDGNLSNYTNDADFVTSTDVVSFTAADTTRWGVQDGTGTDDQTVDQFNITSNTLNLSLEDDGQIPYTVDLSPYLDNTDTQLTQEQVEDFAFDATRFATGTQTLITVTYDDVNNNVDFVVDGSLSNFTNDANFVTSTDVISFTAADTTRWGVDTNTDTQLTQEEVQDFVGTMVSGNTESLISVIYDDPANEFDFTVEANLSNYTNDANFVTSTNVASFTAADTTRWGTSGGGGANQLNELSDVNTSTPTNRNVLIADGVDWESRALTEADISDLNHYNLTQLEADHLAQPTASIIGNDSLMFLDITTGDYANTAINQISLDEFDNSISSFISGNESITLSGDVTGSGATAITTTIAVDAVDIPMLSATGTADGTTFLRGDNTWATPTDTKLTQEEVEDFAFDVARFGTGTRTLITVTYDDVNNNVDFVVDGNLSNYTNDANFITSTDVASFTAADTTRWGASGSDGDGIYDGSGVVPSLATATLINSLYLQRVDADETAQLVIQNTSTGDATIKFDQATVDWAIGIDNSDSDVFKITRNSSTLGANDLRLSDTQSQLNNYVFGSDQTVGAGQDNYVLTYDDGTGEITLEAASGANTNLATDNLTQDAEARTYGANGQTLTFNNATTLSLNATTEIDLTSTGTGASAIDITASSGGGIDIDALGGTIDLTTGATAYDILLNSGDDIRGDANDFFVITFNDDNDGAGDFAIYNDATQYMGFSAGAAGKLRLHTYTTTGSHTGTVVGYLAFDASGNVITVAEPTGSGLEGTTDGVGFDLTDDGTNVSFSYDWIELTSASTASANDSLMIYDQDADSYIRVAVKDMPYVDAVFSGTGYDLSINSNALDFDYDWLEFATTTIQAVDTLMFYDSSINDYRRSAVGDIRLSILDNDANFVTSTNVASFTAADTTRWGSGGATLTQEEVEDFAFDATRFGTGTQTGITVTYDDANNNVDFIVAGVKLDDALAPDDNTDLNASASAHGLLPKLSGNSATYLDGSGTWTTPTVGNAEGVAATVYNETGSTITKGSAVYINGFKTGNDVPTVALAQANSASTMPSFGIVVSDIANNNEGQIVVSGQVSALNTSSYTVGDMLYIDPSVAGGLTTTKPVANNLIQKIAIVTRANVSQGVIEVQGAGRVNDIPNFTAADKFWYGGTGGVGTEGDITAFGRSLIDDANAATGLQTLGLTATATEINLLDLAGLTDGWVLSATGATTASWSQLQGSDINNDLNWITGNETITLSGDVTGSGTTAITTTIAADAVEGSMLNDNVISSQDDVFTPASTDDLLLSDAGVLKKFDLATLGTAWSSGNTETLITVTYQSADNTIDFEVENDLSLYDNATSNFSTGAHTGDGIYDGSGTVPTTTVATLTDNLEFGTDLLFIDETNNKIGMGIGASTDGFVHIQNGSAGAISADANADELVIEGSGNTGLSVLSPDANNSYIILGSSADNDNAKLWVDHDAGSGTLYIESDETTNFWVGGSNQASLSSATNYSYNDLIIQEANAEGSTILVIENSDAVTGTAETAEIHLAPHTNTNYRSAIVANRISDYASAANSDSDLEFFVSLDGTPTSVADLNTTQATLRNFVFGHDQTVGVGQDNYVLTYDNGSGEITLEASDGDGIYGGDGIVPSLATAFITNSLYLQRTNTEETAQLVIQNTSTGDAAIKFDQATVDWAIGIDNSDSDVFKITRNSSTLGANDLRLSDTQSQLNNYVFGSDQTVGVGQDNYVLTYDNGTGEITLEATAASGLIGTTDGAGYDLTDDGTNVSFAYDYPELGASNPPVSADAIIYYDDSGTDYDRVNFTDIPLSILNNDANFVTSTNVASFTAADTTRWGTSGGTNTNLATDNLTQDNQTRTYNQNSNTLQFTTGNGFLVNGMTGTIELSTSSTFGNAIDLNVTGVGGDLDIDVNDAVTINSDDILLTASTEIDLTSTGTGTNAIDINATGTGGDISVDADDNIFITAQDILQFSSSTTDGSVTIQSRNGVTVDVDYFFEGGSQQFVINKGSSGQIAAIGLTDVDLGNFTFNVDQTVGAGQDNYVLTYDDGSGEISLEAASTGQNLATDNLTQDAESRTYNGNSQNLTWNSVNQWDLNGVTILLDASNDIGLESNDGITQTINTGDLTNSFIFNEGSVPDEISELKHTGQWQFTKYTTTGSFTGTQVGYLAFDASGNILTTANPNTNLATDNLTQDAESRTYNGSNQSLTFLDNSTFSVSGANIVTLTGDGGTAGAVDINATGAGSGIDIDFSSTGTFDVSGGTTQLNASVELDLTSTATGATAIDINSSGGIDIDATGASSNFWMESNSNIVIEGDADNNATGDILFYSGGSEQGRIYNTGEFEFKSGDIQLYSAVPTMKISDTDTGILPDHVVGTIEFTTDDTSYGTETTIAKIESQGGSTTTGGQLIFSAHDSGGALTEMFGLFYSGALSPEEYLGAPVLTGTNHTITDAKFAMVVDSTTNNQGIIEKMALESGEYDPNVTTTGTETISNEWAMWQRIGNRVHVKAYFTETALTSGSYTIDLEIPAAADSNFAAGDDVIGSAHYHSSSGDDFAAVTADQTNDTVQFVISTSATGGTYVVDFMYEVK